MLWRAAKALKPGLFSSINNLSCGQVWYFKWLKISGCYGCPYKRHANNNLHLLGLNLGCVIKINASWCMEFFLSSEISILDSDPVCSEDGSYMLCWDVRLKSNVDHQNLCHGANHFCMSLTVKLNCSLLCAFYQCIILTCILILMIHVYHLIPPNTWYLNFFFHYLIRYWGTNLVRCLVLDLFMEGFLIDPINMNKHVKLVI